MVRSAISGISGSPAMLVVSVTLCVASSGGWASRPPIKLKGYLIIMTVVVAVRETSVPTYQDLGRSETERESRVL